MSNMTSMMIPFCFLFAALGALQAQQVVAPTPEQVGPARGENSGNYNITNSFETGYRWSLVGGSLGEYRSDVNYRNGIRLLGSSLSIDSKEGHGHWFDQILLNTMGLGNDPYQSAILRIQKTGLYRYDMTWRLNDYYNPGLTVAGGAHLMDTVRRVQDHDITLLPQGRFRFRVGYSRNSQNGPALSTAQEFDVNGFGLPVFADVRRQWNEYRLGADVDMAGFKFTVLRRWDFYKEDTPYSSAGVVAAGTRHVIVGAGHAPSVVLMIGSRREGAGVSYPASAVAARHGASVSKDTNDPDEAYADWPQDFEPVRLPWPPSA